VVYKRLTDAQWEYIEIVFPEQLRGKPRTHSDRECLDALRYLLETGCQWCNLPEGFPPKSTVHDRLILWKRQKIFTKLLLRLRRKLPQSAEVYHLDATIKMAKKGRPNFQSR
jgi:transposase